MILLVGLKLMRTLFQEFRQSSQFALNILEFCLKLSRVYTVEVNQLLQKYLLFYESQ